MVSNNYVGSTPTFGTKKIKSQTSMNYLTKAIMGEKRFIHKKIEFENYFINPDYLITDNTRINVSSMFNGVYSFIHTDPKTIKKFYNELSDQKCNS